MKILIISYHFSFSDSTGSLRPRAMAKYLPKNGIEVVVLTYQTQSELVSYNENIIGVKDITRDTVFLPVLYAWRIWQKGFRALGFYRAVHEYWRTAILNNSDAIISRVKPDVILVTYPSAEALEIGVALSEKYGLPLVSDFRDGFLFESVEEVQLKHTATRRYYEDLEAKVIAMSRLVLTVSEPISSYFRERYAHSNVMTLPNGFDSDGITPDMNIELPSGIINIVHTGRLGTSEKGRGIDALSEALHILLLRLPDMVRKFQVHFVGHLTLSEKMLLSPLIDQGIVKLWGHQPRPSALAFQRKADILLLITAPDKASIATGKIFEYLATRKFILALTRGTEAERIINETCSGIVVDPDNSLNIYNSMKYILQNFDNLQNKKRNIDAEKKYMRNKQMELLALKLKHQF